MSALIDLFKDLDRLGPGNAESLRWVLDQAQTPADARVLDAGCGTGADLGVLLSRVPDGQVTALDSAAPFIDRVRRRFPRVDAVVGDMREPPGGPYDLIWAAGAIYTVGVGPALAAWRGHLRDGGRIAFSDLRLRIENPPRQVVDFFAAEGGTLSGAAALESEVRSAGYRVLGARWLGTAGWASYFGPLEAHLDSADADPGLIEQIRREISLWRTHGVAYGYRIVVCEPA